jgi:hypothetical protein
MHKKLSKSFEIIQYGGNFAETITTKTRKEERKSKIDQTKKQVTGDDISENCE